MNIRTKKHMYKVLALAAVAPFVLSACGGGNASNSGGDASKLTLLDYYNNEPDNTIMKGAIDKCAAEVGVSISREAVPGKDLIQKVLQKSSSKTLPDVLMLDNPDLQQIAATGGLAPLSDFGVDTSGFAKGMLEAGSYQGKVYGLAPTANTLGLFYNKKLLAAAGLKPPTTWAELKTTAKALTKGSQYGVAFSAIATYEGAWQFLPFMWTNGGDETNLDSPQNREALQLWKDLVDSGSASKGVINWSQGDVKDQFMAGKTAMMINGPWQIPALDADKSLEWGSVQVPINKPGQTPVAPLGGEVWTVPQTGNKAKQAKAAEFISCFTKDSTQLSLSEARYTVPTKPALAKEFVAKMPTMESFTEQVANARSRTGKLGDGWPKAATTIYTAIQLALTGKASVGDAFKQAANG
ncbi:multiple sugar transport system substrate-binding protein [Arthrobacter silviterrae]|uniref:ABC transporter substrate-binding protein n=1 Tax=Arthrobacter silviterrae TaxID=2026658 RepID=A0ABX0D5L5_9MICC|nr:ABC transporter substrate-binding protein [Arthrobacter silviterrae]MDQ0278560.1 multiple sugar transport system substrate-binding protein [Arthrobacter silviterrae]NGN82183.1 ABC transporter substrate-binding protein [Arthrobacter silviterrae]